MISLADVTLNRGKRVVLAGVSVQATAGDVIAMIGPNGSGKSTLLAAAAGLLVPASGSVRAGTEALTTTTATPRQWARTVGYLPQHVDYAFGPTVLDVVLLGRYAHTSGLGLASDHDLALASAALRQCQAHALAERRFAELSGGERQRVLVAQLLCQDAPVWLLDEPTSGLDPLHAHRLWDLIAAQAGQGRTVVIATHDLSLARQFATQMWLVHDAQVTQGAVDEVLASPAASAAFGVRFALADLGDVKYVVPVVPPLALPPSLPASLPVSATGSV